jgi:hypothetical protein
MKNPRIIAYYLPQFHPVPENDEWWGKGFTEWTNVGKAKPLFPGHYQPRVPADLGYYDLRVPETREYQATLARKAGIEGFCYWHYWFGNGRRLLERPFDEVLRSGKPEYPFCLSWANESWKGFAYGVQDRNTLIEQLYCGVDDYKNHFYTVLPALRDRRYITVDDKPLFVIYNPFGSSEISVFIATWRRLAKENGLPGIFFVGHCLDRNKVEILSGMDLDAVNIVLLDEYFRHRNFFQRAIGFFSRKLFRMPYIVSYKKASKYFFDVDINKNENIISTIISGWDHSPRSGRNGVVMTRYTPELFRDHAEYVVKHANNNCNMIFLKSWNEWAEGNYMEPDLKWGREFLDVLARIVNENSL